MNKLEKSYSEHLEALKAKGEVLWWSFEAISLKLADGCRYNPDFLVLKSDGALEVHETKGRWMDDAKVKIKVAAAKFPLVFRAIYAIPKRDGGGFREEEF